MNRFHFTTIICLSSSAALALDASEMSSLRDTIHEICVSPDRTGDYLKTEGEISVGSPVFVRLAGGKLSGKLSYEKWHGISIVADKYKTDPRQCAIEILKILRPAMHSDAVNQSTSGPNSPNISGNSGTINFNASPAK
ncbi:hypothetical protein [Bradyrhizobium tropiciagri]|uniref:hypothetical protein n=1 Tax=Bradyrhizobium tropiciagri TaxID=312253 RepID=UPI00067D48AA|nr:hypothetical protein [Bradyrhizobium tropiciagri]